MKENIIDCIEDIPDGMKTDPDGVLAKQVVSRSVGSLSNPFAGVPE